MQNDYFRQEVVHLEYVFGTNEYTKTETLMTKGASHTDLTGFCTVSQSYPDCSITDSFFITRKRKAAEDPDGNCYDWYDIDKHNRNVDKTGQIAGRIDEIISTILEG